LGLKNDEFGVLSCFGDLLYFNDFLFPKVFGVFKNGQKKCPKMKKGERLWQNTCFVTEM
jgi:hypothetical protein